MRYSTAARSDDTFIIADGVNFNGSLNGGAGNDTLNYSNLQSPISVSLTALGATDGFNGTASAIANGFSNINNVVGGNGNDTLTGLNANSDMENGKRQQRQLR